MSSLLLSERVTLKLRPQQTGVDRYDDPVYGPSVSVPDVPAWWEPAGSAEELAAAEQVTEKYWVFTEDTRLTFADEVVLQGPVAMVCKCAPPQWQPPGFIVPGFVKVLVERVTG